MPIIAQDKGTPRELPDANGLLTIIDVVGKNKHRQMLFLCSCECGKQTIMTANSFLNSKSCGCYRAINNKTTRLIHGESKKTKEYRAWRNMKSRCLEINNDDYHNYGGRGITVCNRWLHSYQNFLSDMGRSPSKIHSLDRINNNGNYSPDNCKWSTPIEQANNKRNNKIKKSWLSSPQQLSVN